MNPLRKQEVEYYWFKRQTINQAKPTNTPLIDLKRAYYISAVGEVGKNEPMAQLEYRYLKSLLGVTSKCMPDMWREAVVGLGVKPVNDLIGNQILYFQNASV